MGTVLDHVEQEMGAQEYLWSDFWTWKVSKVISEKCQEETTGKQKRKPIYATTKKKAKPNTGSKNSMKQCDANRNSHTCQYLLCVS